MFSYNYSLPKELKDYMNKSINESIKNIREKDIYGLQLSNNTNPNNYEHNKFILPAISFISFLIGYKLGRLSR